MEQTQLDNLARLLASSLNRGNLIWLASTALGRDVREEAGNDIGDLSALAGRMVAALNQADRIGDAISLLRREAHPNSDLAFGLTRILAGQSLDDAEALQQFRNKHEPFLRSSAFQESFGRVSRTVCAIGLGKPFNEIRGSGFLIAPDLVMTNYHVLETYLKVDQTGKIQANAPGDQIFCYFDYLSTPAPDVPPGKSRHASTPVQAAENWLVHARQSLPYDGTANSPREVNREYDYVIIRLAKAIGSRPASKGGGPARGWLLLPSAIDVLTTNVRVIVHQHPGAAPQHFDIGDYVRLDPSSTRVWYSVSTARGSSGGAAVDSEGHLFALHNAEVEGTVEEGRRLNQGIRIDKIAEDIVGAAVPLDTEVPGESTSSQFWSLNDDATNPEPIVGRSVFRELVAEIHHSGKPRVLVVTGPSGSGVKFSARLLRRTLGAQVPVVEFSARELQSLSPQYFLRALIDEVGIRGNTPMPSQNPNETIQKWLRIDLPQWLSKLLDEDRRPEQRPYPIWIIINAVVTTGERLLWAENLKDFVATLSGAHDPGQIAIDLPQFRWLYLAENPETLPLSGVEHRRDDLASGQTYESDFADCFQSAWHAIIDKEAPEHDRRVLMGFAGVFLGQAGTAPRRKVLADAIRSMLLDALEDHR
jgi:Trypsin-like peptidase domain